MITEKQITSNDEKMTDGQETQLKRLIDDSLRYLKLTKSKAQEVLKQGDKLQGKFEEAVQLLSIPSPPYFRPAIITRQITVPNDYKHNSQLGFFKKEHGKKFYSFDDGLNDRDFRRGARQLKPGEKFEMSIVPINKQVIFEHCKDFLLNQKAIPAGPQGLSLVWPLLKDEFPKGKHVLSFSDVDYFWDHTDDSHIGVAELRLDRDNDWNFNLVTLYGPFTTDYCLLLFRELSA